MDKNVSFKLALQHAVAASLRPITGNLVYTTRSGIAAGLKRKGGLGFMPRQIGEEEKYFINLAPSLRGKTVYDIGSYEGVFSAFFGRAIGPEGSLFIFEPNPACQERTATNLKLNGFKFHMEPVGLGSRQATMVLTYPAKEPARSTLDPEISQMISREQVKGIVRVNVQIETLDALVERHDLKPPDFLKIDTEGAELDVLRGAEKTVLTSRPDMFIEMHGADMEQKMALQQQVHSLLQSWNYRVEDFYGNDMSGSPKHIGHIICKPAAKSAMSA